MSGLSDLSTVEGTIKALEAVISAKGADYVYEQIDGSCRYLDDNGNPSCIIGHILVNAGADTDAISSFEGAAARSMFQHLGINSTWKLDTLITNVQAKQDAGYSWGYALEMGKAAISA
jgi:hypothetical protein